MKHFIYIINQNINNDRNFNFLNSTYQSFNSISLPNNSFFESTGSFYNTEGKLKKNIKFVTSKNHTKEDWQILRKIFVNCNKVNFLTSLKENSSINFNLINFNKFKNYTIILNSAISNLNLKTNYNDNISINNFNFNSKFKPSITKINNTKLKIWLNDFYIGGIDPYSKSSVTMINCSKILRIEANNFSHI